MSNKIYLDYQATTPVDEKILKKMLPYFSENFGNPHSNNHEFGRSANSAVDEARANVANLINAETNEAAEALADEKLRSFITAHPELTENFGATAIQGHAVTDGGDS